MARRETLKEIGHVDLLFPSKYLKAADLRGRDVTVTIKDLDPRSELKMRGGKVEAKPVISFAESDKLFCLNKTNAMSIAAVYGPELKNWLGKRITLYPTTCMFGPKEVTAIRIRERAPAAKGNGAKIEPVEDEPEHDEVTGEVAEDNDGEGLSAASGTAQVKYTYL